jgi:hypothetical protein
MTRASGKIISFQPITILHNSLALSVLHCYNKRASRPSLTVFIELIDQHAYYYLVDNRSKRVLWTSGKHPKIFCDNLPTTHQQQYWIHLQNFPAAHSCTLNDRYHLMNVLTDAAVTAVVSEDSTSLMSIEEIESHLKILNSFDEEESSYSTYIIG